MSEKLSPVELPKTPSKDNSVIFFLSSIVHSIRLFFSDIVKGLNFGWNRGWKAVRTSRNPKPTPTTT